MEPCKISIVVPCYNEEGNIHYLHDRIIAALAGHEAYELILVDDGSSDRTLATIVALAERNDKVKYFSFSRNFGHQNALKAGFDHASGDCVISMDADLQHPPELIGAMLDKWREGYDIVYTVRDDSHDTHLFKKITSSFFYRFINSCANLNLAQGGADFRLLDRAVVDELKRINESVLFYRGLFGWLGFRQYGISYVPNERFSGATKYSLRRMVAFALAGITSFSVKPLHFATLAGFALSGLATLYALYALYVYFFTDTAVAGWTSVLASVLFIGGFQLIILGIIGEYIGKMFIEVKRRPHYIVKETNMGTASGRCAGTRWIR
ncbi:glycosyltransferase family 2 protein [Geobacter sp. FeAm09]|nr:glycosyltransferase family 2 protein [Geobacter sp. FeAm09]